MTNLGTLYTLPQVAAMTGISLRSIERGCRAGTIEHTVIGDGVEKQHRRMYPHQVQKLVESRAQGTTRRPIEAVPASSVEDDIAAAIAASRRRLARRTGLRRVAVA